MNHLLRWHAPLTEAVWKVIDDEAAARLKTNLAARKLVDFSGPHGWAHSAATLGRSTPIAPPPTALPPAGDTGGGHAQSQAGQPETNQPETNQPETDQPQADQVTGAPGTPGNGSQPGGLRARWRRVLPLVELRVPFTLVRSELEDVDRGAGDVDLSSLEDAARSIAVTENGVVFHGYPEAGIVGITEASSHSALPLPAQADLYPRAVAKAVALLRHAGIGGPYGLATGPAGFTAIIEAAEHGGYLLLDHLRRILDGPVVRAPGVEGTVVLSLRGGDFVLESGQDLSVGYTGHSADTVDLYIEESITFRVTDPDAAIALSASGN